MMKRLFRLILNYRKHFLKLCRSFYYFRNFNVGVHGKIYIGIRKNIKIGKHCSINRGVTIQGFNEIVIGNHVVLSVNSMLLDGNLDHENMIKTGRRMHKPGFIYIGDYVWIGAGAIVLPNVSIGDRSIIAAGAVVSKSVPEDTLAAGNPADCVRRLKGDQTRKDGITDQLFTSGNKEN